MAARLPVALIVGDEGSDPLVGALTRGLERRGYAPRRVAPGELALLPVALDAERVEVGGEPLAVAILRCAPRGDFAASFAAGDAGFASAETRAVWLEVLSRPGVRAVNRGDCDVWFAASEWAVWHGRLVDAGLPAAPLEVGDAPAARRGRRWLQWGGGVGRSPERTAARCFGAARIRSEGLRTSLWCCGEVVTGDTPLAADGLAILLAGYGVRLAALALDDEGRIAALHTTPAVAPEWAEPVAARLLDAIAPPASGASRKRVA